MRTVDYRHREHQDNAVYPSPFHSRQKKHNQTKEWTRWYDYLSVPAYWCADMEYFAGRNACGVFDLTPMVKHRVVGPDALPYLERLVTRKVSKIKPGRVGYSVWCNEAGQVIDDGTIFHRVIPNFMIQGGGFTSDMKKKSAGKPIKNEADNGLKNDRGTVAMARTSEPHSATNQFFINTADNDFLDFRGKSMRGWGYTVFGKVIEGQNIAGAISRAATGPGGPFTKDVPKTQITIIKMTEIKE